MANRRFSRYPLLPPHGKLLWFGDDSKVKFSLQFINTFSQGNPPAQISDLFGPTCDALDTISLAEELPDLKLGDLVYSENIGAYSHASSTYFNGFPPAKVLHINRD